MAQLGQGGILTLSQDLLLADQLPCLESLHKRFYWRLLNKMDHHEELLVGGSLLSMIFMI
jgi:hypothetical protein